MIDRQPLAARAARRRLTAGRLALATAIGAAVMQVGACSTDKILNVTDIDVPQPGALQGKGALPTLYAGAVGDFGVAYQGNGSIGSEGEIIFSGLLADEFIDTESFPTRIEIDQRMTQSSNSSLATVFYDLQRARAAAENTAASFITYDPTNPQLAEVLSLGGYSYILLAENWCGNVPISTLNPNGSVTFGPGLTTTQLLDRAIAKFDSAATIAAASEDDDNANLAAIGKARALLDEGKFALAGAAVAAVPTSYRYDVFSSLTTARQNNNVYTLTIQVGRFGVSDREGTNGLPFVSDHDPRTPTELNPDNGGKGFDGITPQYLQLAYPNLDSNLPLATGVEARLIEAEAALQAGSSTVFVQKLNQARAASGGTGTVTDPGTPNGRIDLLFKERAYDLWLTSHRLGDLRRLITQYGRSSESVFPTGAYHKGGSYGTDVNLPVPQVEENNPQYAKASCVKTQA